MRLYIDLRSNRPMRAPGIPGGTQHELTRGTQSRLEVQFLADGRTPVVLDGVDGLTFVAKPLGQFDVAPLIRCADWEFPLLDDAEPVYVAYPNLNTADLNALFFVDGDPANDVAKIDLQAALSWQRGSGPKSSTLPFAVSIFNDLDREGDVSPDPIDPPDAYERRSAKGQPMGYAPLNAAAIVVGVPVQISIGFPFTPLSEEVDRLVLNQDADFAATGHWVVCTGIPSPAPVFTVKANGDTIAEFTAVNGTEALVLDAPLNARGLTEFSVHAPVTAVASAAGFSVTVIIKGRTV